jgi:hypothetical protein
MGSNRREARRRGCLRASSTEVEKQRVIASMVARELKQVGRSSGMAFTATDIWFLFLKPPPFHAK